MGTSKNRLFLSVPYFKLALFLFICAIIFSCALLFSCSIEGPVQFPLGYNLDGRLYASGRAAREGTLDFSKPKKLEYRFDDSFSAPHNSSLVIEYDFSFSVPLAIRENYSLVLDTGIDSWELPLDVKSVQYALPIRESFGGSFSISLGGNSKIEKIDAPVFKIRSMRFIERWFGFNDYTDEYLLSTPFVHRRDTKSYVIDVPKYFLPENSTVEIAAYFPSGSAVLEFSGWKIEALPGSGMIYIPPSLYKGGSPLVLHSNLAGVFALYTLPRMPPFPLPLEADPALVIAYPKENWRNKTFEVFRWKGFDSLLIFDFADYAAQDRMLKRLAFFVEKAGFRGRLASDKEIEELHGWNAHDYKAEDLASFFNLVREKNFPLLDEELQLKEILLSEKIINAGADGSIKAGIIAGHGGMISISRESSQSLRYRFMAHEGFHGLFFIDEDFRAFSRRRWEGLSPVAKRFLISFFEFQQYDTKDEYLLINEFMAHVLQQSPSAAAEYFGKNLPQRLESSWRAAHLPKKDEASGSWPALAETFTTEAQAFSDYVNQRWGLAAGRVWTLRVGAL